MNSVRELLVASAAGVQLVIELNMVDILSLVHTPFGISELCFERSWTKS